jgi:hypothetical protein
MIVAQIQIFEIGKAAQFNIEILKIVYTQVNPLNFQQGIQIN